MSAAAWLAALGGYDGEAVELLFEAQHRRQLAWLGVAALGSAAVLALGCGLLAWWASSSQWATWVTASSAFLFFANVFRLLGAGSGVHPGRPQARWQMTAAAWLLPLLWAGLLSQPLAAASLHGEVAQVLAQHEREQAALARGVLQPVDQEGTTLQRVAPAAKLTHSGSYVGLRLTAVWATPWKALGWTLVWTLLGVLQPLLRVVWRRAGQAYAERHAWRMREVVLEGYAEHRIKLAEALEPFGHAELPDVHAAFADPPFCTRWGRPV